MNKNFSKTAAQVDRLQNTMSIFMKRITTSISSITNQTPNQSVHDMDDLQGYLESYTMDIEPPIKKLQPTSAVKDSLRDMGSK